MNLYKVYNFKYVYVIFVSPIIYLQLYVSRPILIK